MLIAQRNFRSVIRTLTAVAACNLAATAPALAGFKDGRVETEVGDLKVRLDGRFMYDGLLDSSLPAADENNADWRRARLGLRLNWDNDWRFRASADTLDDEVSLRDLRVEYRGWPVHLALGRMQEPFGMSENESSNNLGLMERPLATVLGPDFSTGVRANTRGKNWGLTMGVFGPDIAGLKITNDDENADESINARATYRPLRTRQVLLHLGASVSHRETEGGVRFNSRPESTLLSGLNISHPRIEDADQYGLYGLEFALRNGPRLLKAEYIAADVDRDLGAAAQFDGYYVEGSWALTGERRRYSVRNGVFGGIDPKRPVTDGGLGAWEIAARYSRLNLRDADIDLDGDIDGEDGEVTSLGLNWYPVRNARVMVNALRISEIGGSSTDKENAVQIRAQFFF
ncbi:hypothetical protein FKG94_01400 [Exilibacterium tricleocarpae]|uniref:Porin n=1 Tax=Exilibacterium tricleocarpae TaxID=2591008 RepID=A0A545U9T1_9GAMM|nr:porin [Exilibacterium tricleocarpae]TQV86235.1 hypothetical protein FKG94_01400 [Exilibacterium tricleocarpae]